MKRRICAAQTLAVLMASMISTNVGAQVSPAVLIGERAAQILARGDAQETEIEIVSAAGQRVRTGKISRTGAFAWDYRDAQGRPVPPGIYLATITTMTSAGQIEKRVEQIAVGGGSLAPGLGTGAPTFGRIARFSGTSSITDSVIEQSAAGNIGINSSPIAAMQVYKAKAASSAGNGIAGTYLLLTSGGAGGDVTSPGRTAGIGGGISLLAGNGGNAVAGSTNGVGGNIALQPGSAGAGGAGGAAGNVLLAPFVGKVGIGTTNPLRAVQIGPSPDAAFTIEPSDASPRAGFIRFGDNTGWELRIGRSREASAGPLNTGLTGSIVTIRDSGAFHLNSFPLGSTGVGPLCRTLSNAITMCQSSSSSLRYKTNVKPYQGGLDVIGRLEPIAFKRKLTGDEDVGLAAEAVEKVEPRLIFRDEKGEIDGVKYELLSVLFINALKQQQAELERQRILIDQLQERLSRLESHSPAGFISPARHEER